MIIIAALVAFARMIRLCIRKKNNNATRIIIFFCGVINLIL
jgi:hypothetical protein